MLADEVTRMGISLRDVLRQIVESPHVFTELVRETNAVVPGRIVRLV